MKIFWITLCIVFCVHLDRAYGSEAGMPQLNPEFWFAQIFWLILIFSFLYFIIWKIFLPKITYNIENRKSRLVNDLNEAEKLKETAQKKLQEYYIIIENSKKEAKKISEDSKKKLDKEIQLKKNKFDEEIDKEIKSAEQDIKNLKESSISGINKIASETAEEIIKKIINSEINKSSVSAVVSEVIKKKGEKHLW
jgi:F-type H+-transporting ATPase subunit b